MSQGIEDDPIGPDSPHRPYALALAAVAVAFAKTLRGPNSDEDVLVTIQRHMIGSVSKLKNTPTEVLSPDQLGIALDILRLVRDRLRDPAAIEQPKD